jgi:putative oxygen-independent coproporphyrinogen III oxidase
VADRVVPLEVSGAPGLYLHVPFCSRVCPYCDFAVQVGGPERRRLYVESLLREIVFWGEDPRVAGWRFDTLYLGGGTPSLLAPEVLAEIFTALRGSFTVEPDAWILFEANPEDVTAESLRTWRELGVRTLSLGVQSFDAENLRFLGRCHGAETARRSVERAREAGFDTVSLDLIYGLPGQTSEDLQRELETAVGLRPDHLSCYQLTIHRGTWFGRLAERGELTELGEPRQAELFERVHRFLADAGYPAYEVSNFARMPEHRSKHNPKYWRHVPYLGLGPSAHSFGGLEGEPGRFTGRRWWNERTLTRYAERLERGERPVSDDEDLSSQDLVLEALALALRTPEGLDVEAFRRRWGWDPQDAGSCARLAESGYLVLEDGALRPTLRGLAVADGLVSALAPPPQAPRRRISSA